MTTEAQSVKGMKPILMGAPEDVFGELADPAEHPPSSEPDRPARLPAASAV
jgi:hypothetical protein